MASPLDITYNNMKLEGQKTFGFGKNILNCDFA